MASFPHLPRAETEIEPQVSTISKVQNHGNLLSASKTRNAIYSMQGIKLTGTQLSYSFLIGLNYHEQGKVNITYKFFSFLMSLSGKHSYFQGLSSVTLFK